MIHITLINYKKLYEKAMQDIATATEKVNLLTSYAEKLKKYHNEAVLRANKAIENIAASKVEHLEENERLCDLLGGIGSLEDRILGAKELIEHQNKALEYAREEILAKDARIADLMSDGITDKDEALMELHTSYQRLHDDYYSLKTLYDNAQKTIDRLCSND